MDGRLIQRAAATAIFAACAFGHAQAQVSGDPMRPPGFGSADSSSARQQNVADQTGLQSILISNGRKLAVISGQTYSIGQRVGEGTLTAIRENEVVIRTTAGSEVLKLHPQAEKKLRQTGKADKKAVEGSRMSAGGK
jgi:hypothetical protein